VETKEGGIRWRDSQKEKGRNLDGEIRRKDEGKNEE
jgi:hypothetical protein